MLVIEKDIGGLLLSGSISVLYYLCNDVGTFFLGNFFYTLLFVIYFFLVIFHFLHLFFSVLFVVTILIVDSHVSVLNQGDLATFVNSIIDKTFIDVIWGNIYRVLISLVLNAHDALMLATHHKRPPKMCVFSQIFIHAIFWVYTKSLLIALTSSVNAYSYIKIGFESNCLAREELDTHFKIFLIELLPNL
jgi:hypothetical protein